MERMHKVLSFSRLENPVQTMLVEEGGAFGVGEAPGSREVIGMLMGESMKRRGKKRKGLER